MTSESLLAVPNFSEGRDLSIVGEIAAAAELSGVRLLDIHTDADHNRSVITIAGEARALVDAVLRAAAVAVSRIDVMSAAAPAGQHPHVGSLDVAPIVHLDASTRGLACATALVLADRLAEELELPVLLYGELTAAHGEQPRTRAQLRRGGPCALAERIGGEGDELEPDFGPRRAHPTAGATLVAARPPLVAFNLVLASSEGMQRARAVAAHIREGGEGALPGLRAIAVQLADGSAQISMNVERPLELPLAEVVAAVRQLARVASAEIVGLAPSAALGGFPEDLPLAGFEPGRHLLENALGC